MDPFSYVANADTQVISDLYDAYIQDPNSVDTSWRDFFKGFDFSQSWKGESSQNSLGSGASASQVSDIQHVKKEMSVISLIKAFRSRGHLLAQTNPVRVRKDRKPRLDLVDYSLSDADLDTVFQAGSFMDLGPTTLRNIQNALHTIYAGSIGFEYSYIRDVQQKEWLRNKIEKEAMTFKPSLDEKKLILQKINEAVVFENFLGTKYLGQKRFGLEGGESTIAALDAIINTAASHDVQEVVIGMAHRGRLNVLANIMGKTYEQIFSEFEGTAIIDQTMGSGDVKYHMGYGSEITTPDGQKIHLKLAPNPSHLEAVDPVVLGFARAKADVLDQSAFDKYLPILIHGDASVAGQGIVYEVLQMSNLRGYHTGGTIHFVINNQIGFTTDFDDARSADYCTSVASMVQAPVLHVNGDDAEAVVKCAEIATRYRQKFNSDIFIDMVCYRRHGHNEGDDPKYTQPQLYSLIDKHQNPRETYTQFLIQNGEPEAQALAKDMEKKFWADLQERLDEVKQHPLPYKYQAPELAWQNMGKATEQDFQASPVTAVSQERFNVLFERLMQFPQDFKPLKKVEKLLQEKIKLMEAEQKVDWATA
jgi:2-oxoglutarate dehydrogenase E1 component